MWIKTKDTSIDYYGKPIAFAVYYIKLFSFRLKGKVTLINNVKFDVTSEIREPEEEFEKRVQVITFNAWLSYLEIR